MNEVVSAVFESVLILYDPDNEGFLEDAEKDIDKLVLSKVVSG